MKHHEVPTRVLSAVLLVLLALGSCPVAQAIDVTWIGPDGGNWNTPANWSNTFGPAADFNEAAVIGAASPAALSATVVLNQQTMSDLPPLSPVNVAGVRLGTAAGSAGGVRVEGGGILPVIAATGEAGAIAVGVNATGTGTLTVLGNGMVSAVSLSSGGAGDSSISLSDTASVALTGAANLQRTTTVVGPSVNFSAGGNLTLGGSHTLVADIRNATNHSSLKSTGTANVSGVLKPMFMGVTPAAGNTWPLIDATTINGNFSSIDTSMAPALAAGLAYQATVVNGGMNGRLLQLGIEEVLTLNVNRTTGAVSIANLGSQAKTIDGYSILSDHGSLRSGSWNSLQDQTVAGWVEAGPTANALSELNPQNSSTLNGGQMLNLGNAYEVTVPQLGVDPDDLTFEYTLTDGRVIQGSVAYTGPKTLNDFVLTVDPATGNAQIKLDSPLSTAIDGYTIKSASGSLTPATWNSIEDQNFQDWEEAPPGGAATAVAELKADGQTTFQDETGFQLGQLFKTVGATQDLEFEYLLPGETVGTAGTVVYGAITDVEAPGGDFIPGDFAGDGAVEGADLSLLLGNWGADVSTVPATWDGDPPTPPFVDGDDLSRLLGNWGNTAGGGAGATVAAVPEPTTVGLLMLAALGLAATRRSHR